jgi:hypothetical protein
MMVRRSTTVHWFSPDEKTPLGNLGYSKRRVLGPGSWVLGYIWEQRNEDIQHNSNQGSIKFFVEERKKTNFSNWIVCSFQNQQRLCSRDPPSKWYNGVPLIDAPLWPRTIWKPWCNPSGPLWNAGCRSYYPPTQDIYQYRDFTTRDIMHPITNNNISRGADIASFTQDLTSCIYSRRGLQPIYRGRERLYRHITKTHQWEWLSGLVIL